MPNFKEFIKGFEEKPEAKNPNPAPTPKQQPLFDDIETPEQKYSKGYAPNMTYGQAQKAYQEGKISHSDLMRVWHQGGYAKKNLEQAEKHEEKYLKEKKMRPGSDPTPTTKPQPEEAPKDEPKEEPLFDEYELSTKKGLEEAKNFLDAKGVKDIYALNNEQFNALADEAAKKYGISRGLAKEFLVAPYDEDTFLKPQPKPKQGTFQQAFNDMSKPEQDLGDFNPTERIEDYQSGAKTHSENEFRLEALNDRGMYDFISKNRDYLYRKANSDPEGAINDIIRHGQNNYGIKPENIRKDFAMEVLKEFYEDDEGTIPDFTKQEEFKPSEQIEEFNDYYGAKTASERNLNLLTGNDRGAYEYVSQNRNALAKEAEYDPVTVLNKIKWHASDRNFARELKGDSIRKDYLINVIKGIVED